MTRGTARILPYHATFGLPVLWIARYSVCLSTVLQVLPEFDVTQFAWIRSDITMTVMLGEFRRLAGPHTESPESAEQFLQLFPRPEFAEPHS